MSDCEQHSDANYIRMDINEFAKVVDDCDNLAHLLAIKRLVDGIIYQSRICPRYIRLYPDLNNRRDIIVARWETLVFSGRKTTKSCEPVTL